MRINSVLFNVLFWTGNLNSNVMNKVNMKVDDTTNKLNIYTEGKTYRENGPWHRNQPERTEWDLPVKPEKNKKL